MDFYWNQWESYEWCQFCDTQWKTLINYFPFYFPCKTDLYHFSIKLVMVSKVSKNYIFAVYDV